jgi:hypothetical protein
MLQRCQYCGASLSPNKCFLFITFGESLRHYIVKEGISIDPSKVKAIVGMRPLLTYVSSIHTFLGYMGYHHNLICIYPSITKLVECLLTKGVKFEWFEVC